MGGARAHYASRGLLFCSLAPRLQPFAHLPVVRPGAGRGLRAARPGRRDEPGPLAGADASLLRQPAAAVPQHGVRSARPGAPLDPDGARASARAGIEVSFKPTPGCVFLKRTAGWTAPTSAHESQNRRLPPPIKSHTLHTVMERWRSRMSVGSGKCVRANHELPENPPLSSGTLFLFVLGAACCRAEDDGA